MKTQEINQMESNILKLEKALQGIGKNSEYKKKYASKMNGDSLNMLRETKKTSPKLDIMDKPILVVIAGSNGSGKTTITEKLFMIAFEFSQ